MTEYFPHECPFQVIICYNVFGIWIFRRNWTFQTSKWSRIFGNIQRNQIFCYEFGFVSEFHQWNTVWYGQDVTASSTLAKNLNFQLKLRGQTNYFVCRRLCTRFSQRNWTKMSTNHHLMMINELPIQNRKFQTLLNTTQKHRKNISRRNFCYAAIRKLFLFLSLFFWLNIHISKRLQRMKSFSLSLSHFSVSSSH